MKGIIFNAVEDAVVRHHGEDVWDGLLEEAGVDGAYTAVGNYPGTELLAIVEAASTRLGMPVADVLRWAGREAMRFLGGRYPGFLARHEATMAFVATLDDVIHPEVRKLYQGAETPSFTLRPIAEGEALLEYRSRRPLCHLAEGLLSGVGDHYDEEVAVTQTTCVHEGADHCVLRFTVRPRR